jgi:hypothetical protein
MSSVLAAFWGLAGGLRIEGFELYSHIRRTPHWSWRTPIPQGMSAYLISVVIRAGIGAVLAAAAVTSGQVTGVFGAFGLGVGAPLVLEKLARLVPLNEPIPPKYGEISNLYREDQVEQPGKIHSGDSNAL